MTNVTISTPDAEPGLAPYKVSNIPGHTTATLTFNINPGPLNAWRVHRGGSGITSGTMLAGKGMVTGLSRCGAPDAMPTAIPGTTSFNVPITSAMLTAEGSNTINYYIYSGGSFQ